jgi:phage host-nuclease inhibitor protein Gam
MPKAKHKAVHGYELEARELADRLLSEIRIHGEEMAALEAEMYERIEKIRAEYDEELAPYRVLIASADKSLLQIMKVERKTLFACTDVVNLVNGSLIRNEGYKVTIPRDALEKAKQQGFKEVIKTVESLDRDAVEKWENWKLELIGAERKTATKYSYEVKK